MGGNSGERTGETTLSSNRRSSYQQLGRSVNADGIAQTILQIFWMGKHTLFPPSFGWFMKWLGGVPINRNASHNIVHETVCQYREHDELVILIPPEGTRGKVQDWKSGFYHIANMAEVPILLGYVDAANKEAGMVDFFTPTGDIEKDMQEIRTFYANKKGLRADNS